MPVMTTAERKEVVREFMRTNKDPLGNVVKLDLFATVDALDDYLNAEAGTINTTIPQPARAELTTPQKALFFNLVNKKRYITGA